MSISNALSHALSGLTAMGRKTDITSNNLANALTEGYGRQSVELGSLVLNGRGAGVSVNSVNRAISPDLTAARRQADSEAAAADVTASALADLGVALGEAGGDQGLFDRLESFESALRNLAESPELQPRQAQAADSAAALALKFNDISSATARAREIADREIAAGVDVVNSNLEEIVRVNRKIQFLSAGGRDVAGLVDQRERLIDEVSAHIPVRVHQRDNNVVHLTTAEGLSLVESTASQIEFTRSPTITAPMIYDPAGGGALSGLSLHGIDITPGSDHPQRISGGALSGHFEIRDEVATDLNARVDQIAAELVQRFEDPAVDPTLAVGSPGLFTDDGGVFDPTAIEGLAGRIGLNVLVDPSQGGDPSLLRDGLLAAGPGPVTSDTLPRAMLDALGVLRPAGSIPGLSGNLSLSEMTSGVVELTGIARVSAESEAVGLASARETLSLSEANEIGVDSDQELQNLILIEQANAANVQVIQAATRMLDELMEI